MGTGIVLLFLEGIIVLDARSMSQDKKAGKSLHCGCDCKHCGGHCR